MDTGSPNPINKDFSNGLVLNLVTLPAIPKLLNNALIVFGVNQLQVFNINVPVLVLVVPNRLPCVQGYSHFGWPPLITLQHREARTFPMKYFFNECLQSCHKLSFRIMKVKEKPLTKNGQGSKINHF